MDEINVAFSGNLFCWYDWYYYEDQRFCECSRNVEIIIKITLFPELTIVMSLQTFSTKEISNTFYNNDSI